MAAIPPEHLERQTIETLCRTGNFPTCPRFQDAYTKSRTSERFTDDRSASSEADDAWYPIPRQLLSSAAWVIGIPTAITLLIVIAIWLTENVWMPTEQILVTLIF
jgi:hypothetical protein